MESNNINYPNLIIGGVFKAGTTSLFTYLSEHHDIGASSKKELGYFVPIQFDNNVEPIEEYLKYFKHLENNKQQYIMEASPGYLYGGEKVAKYMKNILGDFKMIFILRDPAERLSSFYKYLKTGYLFAYGDRLSKEQKVFIEEMSFEDYVKESLAYFKDGENDADSEYYLSGVKYSLYSNYLKEWYETIHKENIKVISFDDLKNKPEDVLNDICSWLQISLDVFNGYNFEVQNQTIEIKNTKFHKVATKINRSFESILRNNLWLKKALKKIYYFINKKETKQEKLNINYELKELFENDQHELNIILDLYKEKGC